MFDNTPFDTLNQCVRVINEQTECIKSLGIEAERQDDLTAQLVDQHKVLIRKINILNHNLNIANSKLAALETVVRKLAEKDVE